MGIETPPIGTVNAKAAKVQIHAAARAEAGLINAGIQASPRSVLIAPGAFHGLFLAAVLLTRSRRYTNRLMAILPLAVALHLRNMQRPAPVLYLLLFLMGTLFYLYVRMRPDSERFFTRVTPCIFCRCCMVFSCFYPLLSR